jgi:hypothetical protein
MTAWTIILLSGLYFCHSFNDAPKFDPEMDKVRELMTKRLEEAQRQVKNIEKCMQNDKCMHDARLRYEKKESSEGSR